MRSRLQKEENLEMDLKIQVQIMVILNLTKIRNSTKKHTRLTIIQLGTTTILNLDQILRIPTIITSFSQISIIFRFNLTIILGCSSFINRNSPLLSKCSLSHFLSTFLLTILRIQWELLKCLGLQVVFNAVEE